MSSFELQVGDRRLEGKWNDQNPDVRDALLAALPIEGEAARWGAELYLTVDVEATPAETTEIVDPGAVAYWPAGPALCLFWGPTPASTDARPRAASPVGVVGSVTGIDQLADLEGPARLRLSTTEGPST